MKERIELTDTALLATVKLSDGNPGAAIALVDIQKQGGAIDPDGAIGGIGFLLLLDSFGIYGSDIYVLHSDICGKDVVKTCAVLRACQLGLLSRGVLKEAASRQDGSGKTLIDVDGLYQQVKKRLPRFNEL